MLIRRSLPIGLVRSDMVFGYVVRREADANGTGRAVASDEIVVVIYSKSKQVSWVLRC